MTGHKKIVGLWRDSATNPDATETPPAQDAAAETASADETGESRAESSMEREWLDMASLDESDAAGAVDETPAVPAPRDRMAPALLILPPIGRTGFEPFVARDSLAPAPALAGWSQRTATRPTHPTLL